MGVCANNFQSTYSELSTGWCKKHVTELITHSSSVFLALTHRYIRSKNHSTKTSRNGKKLHINLNVKKMSMIFDRWIQEICKPQKLYMDFMRSRSQFMGVDLQGTGRWK